MDFVYVWYFRYFFCYFFLQDDDWKWVVSDLSKKMPVAITTQAPRGGVRPQVYEAGAPETAISCGDMTFECSAIKLRWAIGKANGDLDRVRHLMTKGFYHEISTRI